MTSPTVTATASSLVFLIDDDASFRRSTEMLIRAAGFKVQAFSSAPEFIKAPRNPNTGPACLILDVRMPQLTGLQLQDRLKEANIDLPIIFLTGHGDIPMSVQAMKAGAIEFLTKPFEEQHLLAAITAGLARDASAREERAELVELRRRHALLTPREKEVLLHVVQGLLNKQIAAELGTSEKTIKVHRAQAMQKMQAPSLAELVRMAGKL